MPTSWIVSDPGDKFGRVVPEAFAAVDGDHVLVLGSLDQGREARLASGDYIEASQPVEWGSEKFLKLDARLRGPDQAEAVSAAEPFSLSDGDTLVVVVDGAPQVVTIDAADFAAVGTATSVELATVLDDALDGATARASGDGVVRLRSDAVGRASSVTVTGGTGAAAVSFDPVSWSFKVLMGSAEVVAVPIAVGRTRVLNDVAVNLDSYTSPDTLKLRLEVSA